MEKTIIEAILEIKKKYIILISGPIWWDIIRKLIYIISKSLNFELIHNVVQNGSACHYPYPTLE